ncbi:MAG TPA: cytochrome-c peroxidase [Rhodocyclaceae bacterium]|nr:cytochrome-c peroxidase [Rhodocyclaceae bacterium]
MKNRRTLLPILAAAVLASAAAAFLWFDGEPAPGPVQASRYRVGGADLDPAGRGGEPILPLPEAPALNAGKVALGRQLFHDPRLSADGTIACASCHDVERGGADGRRVSIGVGGAEGDINAPSVLTAAYNFRQFWDGRAGTLEEQAGGPIVNPKEMAAKWPEVIERLEADPAIRKAFMTLYRDGVTPANVTAAIAEFERSLPRPSRFDRWLRGERSALTPNELLGYQLFKKHGCVGCHQGVNVGGNLYQRFGIMSRYFDTKEHVTRADQGRYNVTGKEEDLHLFKVPSLRNVALTAPYFHDASAPTLEDAVATMGRYQLGVNLPRQDIDLIVAFLKSLNGEATP